VNGYCECGCGQKTSIAPSSNRRTGAVRGQPRRFVQGHQSRGKSIRGPIGPDRYEVIDHGHESPCWIWNGSTWGNGYGQVWLNGRNALAHRAMYEQETGPIPEGKQLDHLCRVTLCVNPAHLEPVTNAQNVRRGAWAKITPKIAAAIREAGYSKSLSSWASELGVCATTVSQVRLGRTWTPIGGDGG